MRLCCAQRADAVIDLPDVIFWSETMRITKGFNYRMATLASRAALLAAQSHPSPLPSLCALADNKTSALVRKINPHIHRIEVKITRDTYDAKTRLADLIEFPDAMRRPVTHVSVHFLDVEISQQHIRELAELIRRNRSSIRRISFSAEDSGPDESGSRILEPLFKALKQTKCLASLELNLNISRFTGQRTDYEALTRLGESLRYLPGLECLRVSMDANSFSEKAFNVFFNHLVGLSQLRILLISMRKSLSIMRPQLYEELIRLKNLKALEKFSLYLGRNLIVNDRVIDGLCMAISHLDRLKSFGVEINATNCTDDSIAKLAGLVHCLKNVKFFEIEAISKHIRPDIARGMLGELVSLQRATDPSGQPAGESTHGVEMVARELEVKSVLAPSAPGHP